MTAPVTEVDLSVEHPREQYHARTAWLEANGIDTLSIPAAQVVDTSGDTLTIKVFKEHQLPTGEKVRKFDPENPGKGYEKETVTVPHKSRPEEHGIIP